MPSDPAAPASPSPIALRIGSVYTVDDLVSWLRHSGLGDAASVLHAAAERQLVGFLTTDGQWAFPEWSFERADSHLTVREEVAELWRELPHDGFLTDSDLCAWMNTRLVGLDNMAPATYMSLHGIQSQVRSAVRRLNARVR